MKSPFTQFQGGGIEPNPNIAATGRFLGEMAYKSFADAGSQLAEGLKQYQKNAAEDDYLTESLSLQATDLAKWSSIVSQDPKYAPMLDGLMPMMEKASKGPSMSLNQKRALNSQLGAFLKAVPDDLRTIDTVAANQERETAIEADRQGMLGNLTALRNAWSGDPSKSSLLPDIDAQIGNLSGARDRQGKLSALAQSKNYFTLLPELKDAANRSAVFNANQIAPDVASTMATMVMNGNKGIELPTVPLVQNINGKKVEMTPQEFFDQRVEELINLGMPKEEVYAQVYKELQEARTAISSAKGLEPSVQTEWAKQYDEAISGATSDFTGKLNIGATNRGRPTEVIGKQIQDANSPDSPEVTIANAQHVQWTSKEAYAKYAQEKGRKPNIVNGKVDGYKISLPNPRTGGVYDNLGVVRTFEEEREILKDWRRKRLPDFAESVLEVAKLRGLVVGTEKHEKFVQEAKQQMLNTSINDNYPEGPERDKAYKIKAALLDGNLAALDPADSKDVAWILATSLGVGGAAGQWAWNEDPYKLLSKVFTKPELMTPRGFQEWLEQQKKFGNLEVEKAFSAIAQGRGDEIFNLAKNAATDKLLKWDTAAKRFVDSSTSPLYPPEVVEAATEYRTVYDDSMQKQRQLWNKANKGNQPSSVVLSDWDKIATKEAEAAVRTRKTGLGGVKLDRVAIETELKAPHFEAIVKAEHPEIAQRAVDAAGNFNADDARKLLPDEALTEINKRVTSAVDNALSPARKSIEVVSKGRELAKKIIGGGWRRAAIGGAIVGTTAYLTNKDSVDSLVSSETTPDYDYLNEIYGNEGVITKRLQRLDVMAKGAADSKENADKLRTKEALRRTGTSTTPLTTQVGQIPSIAASKASVPDIVEIPRQQKITNLSNQLMRRTGVSAGDANAIASQWFPQQAGPSVVRVNGIEYYSGNGGTDWKPVPAENIKAAGGSASNFSAVYYGTKAINPVTNKIEIAPVNLGPFSVIGAKPENATERMNLDSKFKIAAIGLRAAEKIREEMKENPVRGGFININGANTEIKQRYLSIFSSLLEQSGQGERPSDRDVQNINEAVAKVSDYFTRDNTGMKGLQAYVEDTRFALQNEAKLSGLQISFVRSAYFDTGDDLTSLTSEARTSVLK